MTRRLITYALLIAAASFTATSFAQSLVFKGNSLKVIEVIPEKSTGLDMIYVLYSSDGVSASFTSASGNRAVWYRYGEQGGAYSEEITSSQSGNVSTLASIEGDKGYIVEDGDRRYYFWITDYRPHRLELRAVTPSPEPDCGVSVLNVEGSGDPIRYYTINGVSKTLGRDINISYNTQEWCENENNPNFIDVSHTVSFENFQQEYRVAPPNFCASVFTVSGDRFLREWNWEEAVQTSTVQPVSVDARTFAVQHTVTDSSAAGDDASNQIGSDDTDGLGGSAPCDITFNAYTTDGVVHNEWQLTDDPTFENIDYRFTSQDLDYTFLEEGTHYLRYIGSNSDGSCEYVSDVYVVSIGESQLLVPNAFSPNGDGVNDEWKVAYRSILEFNCWIFDRQGHQVCHLTSPHQGWDGKVGGKSIDSGVFYYVIEALGSDGKKYKKSGDINVVKYVGTPGNAGNR